MGKGWVYLMIVKNNIMVKTMIVVCLCFLSLKSFSRQIPLMIKDPIDETKQCVSINVKWEGDMLTTIIGDDGTIYCKSTGYIGLIIKDDKLSVQEINSIKIFLKNAKKILNIKGDFNFINMGKIDNLWLLKNIYERRNLTPKQHIAIMNRFIKISNQLTEQLIIEREELINNCLGKDVIDQWCRVFTLKNKVWEKYHKEKVIKANKEDEYKRIQERILAKTNEQEQKNNPPLCNDYNLAKQLALQIMQVQLDHKVRFREIPHAEVNNGERFSFIYERIIKDKKIQDTWWKVSIKKKSCESKFLNGR